MLSKIAESLIDRDTPHYSGWYDLLGKASLITAVVMITLGTTNVFCPTFWLLNTQLGIIFIHLGSVLAYYRFRKRLYGMYADVMSHCGMPYVPLSLTQIEASDTLVEFRLERDKRATASAFSEIRDWLSDRGISYRYAEAGNNAFAQRTLRTKLTDDQAFEFKMVWL